MILDGAVDNVQQLHYRIRRDYGGWDIRFFVTYEAADI